MVGVTVEVEVEIPSHNKGMSKRQQQLFLRDQVIDLFELGRTALRDDFQDAGGVEVRFPLAQFHLRKTPHSYPRCMLSVPIVANGKKSSILVLLPSLRRPNPSSAFASVRLDAGPDECPDR